MREDLESSVRASLYAFLGSGFARPPEATLVESLRDPDLLALLGEGFGDAAVAEVTRFVRSVDEDMDALESAKSEFMRLFKVPGPLAVPPFESLYEDRPVEGEPASKGLLVGPSVIEVQRWYALACVEPDASAPELPHHIAVELQFLSLLCAKEEEFEIAGAKARLERCREIQRDFLAAHLVPWTLRFAQRFMERTQEAWIRALGVMLTSFPQRDLETLQWALGPSAGHKVPTYPAWAE